jgi:regulatory protein
MEAATTDLRPAEPAAPQGRAAAKDPAVRLQHALDLAWRQLNRRDRTVLELRRYLEAKRVEPATIDAVLGELGEQGYLDDASYAARFAEDKRSLEQWGNDRIERRLIAAGVDRELVRETLAPRGREDELEGARELLTRRFPEPIDDPRDERRAFGVLVRKGFDPELAGEAVRAYRRGD